MHLLDDVCLIGSEILAPPTASTFKSQRAMNSVILVNSSVIVHRNMIGSHRWQKNSCPFIFEVEVKSLTPSQ